jgi:hypothetical protein
MPEGQSEEAMTTQQIGHQIQARGPEADAVTPPLAEDETAGEHVPGGLTRAVHAAMPAVHSAIRAVGHGVHGIAGRLPATLRATRAGARWTVTSLQTLPDSTLRSLAATSVGLGAGLSFSRAGRLAAVAGVVPAVLLETAIAVRPGVTGTPEAATE